MRRRDLVVLAVGIGTVAYFLCTPSPHPAGTATPVAVPSASPTPSPPLKPRVLYTINGLHPGMSVAEASAKLGPPTYQDEILGFGKPICVWAAVTDHRIVRVTGSGVRRNGRVWVTSKMTDILLEKRLGRPIAAWNNGSWCGNCFESSQIYPDGLQIRSGHCSREFDLATPEWLAEEVRQQKLYDQKDPWNLDPARHPPKAK